MRSIVRVVSIALAATIVVAAYGSDDSGADAEGWTATTDENEAASVASGAQLGVPTASRLPVGSAGDAAQAVRVTVLVTGDPEVAEVTIDHVVVRRGRSLASLTFDNRTEATPVETIDQYTALIAERLPT